MRPFGRVIWSRGMRCSFCGKSPQEVTKLIAGPRVFICGECVGICVSILNEGGDAAAAVMRPRRMDRVRAWIAKLAPRRVTHFVEV